MNVPEEQEAAPTFAAAPYAQAAYAHVRQRAGSSAPSAPVPYTQSGGCKPGSPVFFFALAFQKKSPPPAVPRQGFGAFAWYINGIPGTFYERGGVHDHP